jgi:hypothetical protein
MGLLGFGTCTGLFQARAAKRQVMAAVSGLKIAERAAVAAEQQVEEARAAARHAQDERETANERARVAEERASLAHEQMKVALMPMLVLLRIQDQIGQKFFVENQGTGFAHEITWDYIRPTIADAAFDSDTGRLTIGFATNALAPNAREEFFFNYGNFQQVGIMFRYLSADGRLFRTHVSLKPNGNGAFTHIHYAKSR